MIEIHEDFETFGPLDLGESGVYLYANHPETGIICYSFATTGNEPVCMSFDEIFSGWKRDKLIELASNPEVIFVGHNDIFEYEIWEAKMVSLGYPSIPVSRRKCTMAKAYAMGMPGSLENLAKALKLENQKDMMRKKHMEKLSKPRVFIKKEKALGVYDLTKNYYWTKESAPEDFEATYEYNRQDVRVEMEADSKLRDLSPKEQAVWEMDIEINRRGVRVDLDAINKAIALRDASLGTVVEDFKELVGLRPTQGRKFKPWLANLGFHFDNLQAPTLDAFLDGSECPDWLRTILELYRKANLTSLAKLDRMLEMSDKFGIIRYVHQYHAAHTGRWGGRGPQFQNMKRPNKKVNIPNCIRAIKGYCFEVFKEFFPDIPVALQLSMRGMIIASALSALFVSDLSQMESRVLSWLAGQEDKLSRFRSQDALGKALKVDEYCVSASHIYGRQITKDDDDERQTGKVSDLSLGYGGGIGAATNMAEQYDCDLLPIYYSLYLKTATYEEKAAAEKSYMLYLKRPVKKGKRHCRKEIALVADLIKQRWRKSHPHIVQYWKDLEYAFARAVETKEPVVLGKTTWFMHGEHLYCQLPSGRNICYPYAKIEKSQRGKVTLTYRYEDDKKKWVRGSTYGGSLAENITQAVQRDLLVDCMLRLRAIGYKLVFHVHDECISDVTNGFGSLPEYIETMRYVPKWAEGVPINANGWAGDRYGKAA
jgi:DNA polymerase bacteriophage-type